MSKINVGQFVRTSNNALGVGKVVERSGSTVVVEYFDSVGADGRFRVEMDATQVERTQLSLQRRCYWQDGETWRVGRVVWQDAGRYAVRIPDSDVDIPVDEASLFVRWDKPIEDPTDVLAAYGNESPHFHACRQPFVESTISQRAASRGMHGLLSAVVEVHNHQVEVVRRVLEDPLQRYLLADEVGLGKTIEAGLVIRQLLLDKPTAHVVVIAPPLLRRQWVAELREKFLIDDFEEATISVLSHDKPDSWLTDATDPRGRAASRLAADLVVVDEVHNLAALHDRPDASGAFASLRTLAAAVPRLLLLSATPLLNNERTFLAMLHLLDPEVYDLGDAAGFERRVASRRDLANAFFTMRPDTPAFLLKEKLEALAGLFPDDAQLADLLAGVAHAGGADEVAEAVTAVRAHISETYRLHRRLLRTRRSDALLSTFPVRGRSRPSSIDVAGGGASAALDWLDAWRVLVRSEFGDESTDKSMAVRAFVAMAERSASNTCLLQAAARYRLAPSDELMAGAELSSDEAEALRSSAPTADERALLESADDLDEDLDALDALAKAMRSANSRTVVFTSFTATAERVATHLRAAFGSDAVATHLVTDDPGEVEDALAQFREDGGACRILVCDRSAEEGRNLQFADAAVFFDLALSPNRFEQRIGRLDRYGQGSPIVSMCLRYPTDSVADAWLACLTDGFRMFDESLASLQFAIDALLPGLHEALFDDGASGLRSASVDLPDRLGAERLAVAEQDALDAVEEATYDRPLAEALDDVEDLWFQHQVAAEDLLSQRHGNLRFHRVIDRSDERFRSYKLTRPGKGASLNSMPLVAWDLLLSRFRPVVDRAGTFSRRSATSRRGSRLFRVGEPLIDALADYVRWDDRGQTFAMWRVWPGAGDDAAYFRFDYVVDAGVGEALGEERPAMAATALKRRADKFLPPQAHTIWTDLDGNLLPDGPVTAALERGYDPDSTDFNLNADRRWALELLVGSEWSLKCHGARRRSEQVLRLSDAFLDAVAKATREFDLARRHDRLQREVRLRHLDGVQRKVDESEFARIEGLEANLSTALAKPTVRLDSIGCVVLSRSVPDGPGFRRR